jgi:hypothetical protein
MSGNPRLGLTRDGDKRFEVIETERCPIALRAGLIREGAGEGPRKERTLLAAILPNRGFDVAASQRGRGVFVGRHLVSSLLK